MTKTDEPIRLPAAPRGQPSSPNSSTSPTGWEARSGKRSLIVFGGRAAEQTRPQVTANGRWTNVTIQDRERCDTNVEAKALEPFEPPWILYLTRCGAVQRLRGLLPIVLNTNKQKATMLCNDS